MLNILENILNSLESIRSNKLRSALSMLWIIIWVWSVIILTAIWNWSQQSIKNQIEELWTNTLTISAWWFWRVWNGGWSVSLNSKLVDKIKNIDWIKSVLPVISTNWQLIYSSNNMSSTIYWITIDFINEKNLEINSWLNISAANLEKMEKVLVIWEEVKNELFWEENAIWKKIKVWNNVFKVIWVLKENSTYWSSVFSPITTISIRISGTKEYSEMIVIVENAENIEKNETDINNLMIDFFEITNTTSLPYRIRNQSEMLESFSSITETLTMLLWWIAWISLLVWWIWVMNIMLVSVTERTKEIWIRKAIGADKKDILMQFLTESGSISVIWWVIWIIISYIVVFILNHFWITSIITQSSIFISFAFSLGIWVIFWLLPAYKAAKLRPINALRFE